MAGNLDQHIGLWYVNGVVSHLGEEHSVHLHPARHTSGGARTALLTLL